MTTPPNTVLGSQRRWRWQFHFSGSASFVVAQLLAVRPTAMPFHFTIALVAIASILTACSTRKIARIEVTPAVSWIVTDGSSHHASTNYYAPFVVSQGVPFTMDFAQHDTFTSPDTQKIEPYLDGVVARLIVTISNSTACFSGRTDYHLNLGVTSSVYGDDESLYGQTLGSYSTRFSGTSALGHELRIGAGEDISNEPVVCFTFRQTTAPLTKFSPEILDDSH